MEIISSKSNFDCQGTFPEKTRVMWELVAGHFDAQQYINWCRVSRLARQVANSNTAWRVRCYAFFPKWVSQQSGIHDKELFKKGSQECIRAFHESQRTRETRAVIDLWGSSRLWNGGKSLLLFSMEHECDNMSFGEQLLRNPSLPPPPRDEGNISLVEQLIMERVGLDLQDSDGTTPLLKAAQDSREDLVDRLLQAGASPFLANNRRETPIRIAIEKKLPIEHVKKLLGEGTHHDQPDISGFTPFFFACEVGNVEVVRLLLEEGVEVDRRPTSCQFTPLLAACRQGHATVAEMLLKAGADPRLCGKEGESTLSLAAMHGAEQLLSLIMAYNLPVDKQGPYRYTALHWAASSQKSGCLEKLLKAGANPNITNEFGETPLNCACNTGFKPNHVTALIKAKADPNNCGCMNRTPLMYAAAAGNAKIVKGLIYAGAKLDIKDKNGMTAYDFAKEKGHNELLPYLKGDKWAWFWDRL